MKPFVDGRVAAIQQHASARLLLKMERQHSLLLFYQVHPKRVLYAFFGKYYIVASPIHSMLM